MKKKIFVTRRLLKENEEKLKELFEVTLNKDDKIYKPQEIIDGSKNFDGILSSVSERCISKRTCSDNPERYAKDSIIYKVICQVISLRTIDKYFI